MRKTQLIELIKTIRKTLISFISITMFVLFGVCIYLGFNWTAEAVKHELSNRYNDNNFYDLEIYYPYGINDNDLNRFKEVDEVDEVEGQFYAFEFFVKGNETHQAKILSITNNINIGFDLEGRLPQNENEILVEKGSSNALGLKINDKISFFGEEAKSTYLINKISTKEEVEIEELTDINSREFNYLKNNEVVIVGIIQNPEYVNKGRSSYGFSINSNVPVSAIFYTLYDSFDPEVVSGYNNVLIRSNKLKNLYTFSDEYLSLATDLKEKVNEVANKVGKDSYQRVKESSNDLIKEGKEKLDEAHNQILDAQNEINEALKEIFKNFDLLAKNEKELQEAKLLLDEAEEELKLAYEQICTGEKELIKAENEYEKAKEDLANYIVAYNQVKQASINLYNYFYDIMTLEEKEVYEQGQYRSDVLMLLFSDNLKLLYEAVNSVDLSSELHVLTVLKEIVDETIERTVCYIIDYMQAYHDDPNIEKTEDADNVYEITVDIKNRLSATDETKITYQQAILELTFKDPDEPGFGEDNNLNCLEFVYHMINENVVDEKEITKKYFGYETTSKEALKIIFDQLDIDIQNAFENAKQKLIEAKQKIEDGKNQLVEGKKQYYKGLSEFKDKKREYEDYVKQLNDGKNTLNKAKEEVDGYQEELDESFIEYEDSVDKYDELVVATDRIQEYGISILTRDTNIGYIYLLLLTDIIINLKNSLGGMFLAISLFVCYSVISRNVFNQIKQIGTKKALGLSQREVTLAFILYSIITIIIGGVCGVLLAYFVVEKVLVPKVSVGYTHFCHPNYFNIKDAILLLLFEFVFIEVVTLIACRGVLKQNAVKLLAGSEPPTGKERFYEKFFIWKKSSLLTKTIVNNFVNDKRRVFATLIGIVGCTALVVSSIMLKNNVLDSFDKQFNDYFAFDTMIYVDTENENSISNIKNVLDKNEIKYSTVYYGIAYVENDKFDKIMIREFIYDDIDKFKDVVKVETTNGEFDYNGAWLSDSIQHAYNLDDKETVKLTDLIGTNGEITLEGFYKYYHYNPFIYMSKEIYENNFKTNSPKNNIFIIDTENIDVEDLNKQLEQVDGFVNLFDYYSSCLFDVSTFETIAIALVGLYSTVSILMSIFVLLNLFDTFVMEKKNELIILMINGFTIKDARRYIYSDTIVLTIIGVILGLIAGSYVGVLAIGAFESENMYLLHNPNLSACVVGALITIILTTIMSTIALKKINKFSLTDINKA